MSGRSKGELVLSDSETGTRHISATRDRSGRYVMIYSPQGEPVSVDLNKIAGSSAVAWWFDPRTGTATRIDTFATGRAQSFSPPSKGAEEDWVLVLDDEKAGFGTPGIQRRQ